MPTLEVTPPADPAQPVVPESPTVPAAPTPDREAPDTPTGPMRSYAYMPHDPHRPAAAYPGLVLYSEIFQQTPPIRRLAVQLSGRGFVVLVPEVFHEHEPPEVTGRLAWRTADRDTAASVGRGAGVLGLSGPPTITGTGRTRDGGPTKLLAVTPFAVDRALVDAQVSIDLTTI